MFACTDGAARIFSPVHSRKHEFTCQQALGERKEEEEEETTSPRPGFDPTTRDLSITSQVFYPLGHGATPIKHFFLMLTCFTILQCSGLFEQACYHLSFTGVVVS